MFRGVTGPRETKAHVGATLQLNYRCIRVDEIGFRPMSLGQLDGVLLALDWVDNGSHHIWGSAVMIAPGVALTARHVLEEMLKNGLTRNPGGYLLAFGFGDGQLTIWNPDSITSIGSGDLLILTLVRNTAEPSSSAESPTKLNLGVLASRMPEIGENLTLVGFQAADASYESELNAGVSLFAGTGPVTDLYPEGRDRSLSTPAVGVRAKTIGGMSGGAAFDAQGRVVGVISSGIGEECSFVSLSWPCVFTPVTASWPPSLYDNPITLHGITQRKLCHIEGIESVFQVLDDAGEPRVGLRHGTS